MRQTEHKPYGGRTYSHNGRPVLFLELTEPTTIDNPCYGITHIERLAQVGAHNAMQFVSRIQGLFWHCWWLQTQLVASRVARNKAPTGTSLEPAFPRSPTIPLAIAIACSSSRAR